MREFGKKIKTLREEQNWSLNYVAKILNIHPSTLKRWESGQPKIKATHILKFCLLFNVTCDYLLGLSSDRHKTSKNTSL